MRLKLTLQLNHKPQLLPLNYKYPVSSWIYHTIEKSDSEFSQWLHEYGYKTIQGKTFRLFTFSDLIIPHGKWTIKGDRMQVNADVIELIIAFQLPEPMQHFISGLFLNQQFSIGDKISQLVLNVNQVEAMDNHFIEKETYRLTTLSPIVVELNDERFKYPQYILPGHVNYASLFINNLLNKYQAVPVQTTGEKIDIEFDTIHFKCLDDNPRSVLQTIKADKKAETKVKAFRYSFELKAPKELIAVGLNAGFGSANAQGFGCCELM